MARWFQIEPIPGGVRDHCPRLECGMCSRFCIWMGTEGHDGRCGKTEHCTRIDHRTIRFYTPWFKSYDCGCYYPYVCRDFEPADWCVWLKAHWRGWNDYWGADVLDAVKKDKHAFIPLVLAGNSDGWCYHVHLWDWWENTFRNADGTLAWFERWRSPARGYIPIKQSKEDET